MNRDSRRPVRLGLVDSGIDPGADGAVAEALTAARAFAWDEGTSAVEEGNATGDELGHGTALAATAVALAPGVELLVARVFFRQWRTRPAQVAAALDWLLASGARVVNLSLGLRIDRPVLRSSCERAVAAGVLLVASTPARGEPVFPAAYPGVIRATGDARCDRSQLSWLGTPQADLGACVRSLDGSVAGASVGAAHISAHIAACLQRQPDAGREQVLAQLRRQASFTGPERRGPP